MSFEYGVSILKRTSEYIRIYHVFNLINNMTRQHRGVKLFFTHGLYKLNSFTNLFNNKKKTVVPTCKIAKKNIKNYAFTLDCSQLQLTFQQQLTTIAIEFCPKPANILLPPIHSSPFLTLFTKKP